MRHLKAKALVDTLADSLIDVEIEAPCEPAAQRYEGDAYQLFGLRAKKGGR